MEDYTTWLTAQRQQPRLVEFYDAALEARVRLAPYATPAYGIQVVEVIGRGFLVLDAVLCRRRFPLLYDADCRYFLGARPISYIEPSVVWNPYVPVYP